MRSFALLGVLLGCTPKSAPKPPDLPALRDQMQALAVGWYDADRMRRVDGFSYTVDIAHLMIHAIAVRDRALYERLRNDAVESLVIDNKDDPYTAGFVAWRHAPGTAIDASGTTEALRLARALWDGAKAFGTADRDLAVRLLKGYCRHAATEGGVWFVRNYFNLQTRAFANDSFLVDYDPDLLTEVARETGDPVLAEHARRSVETVRAARTPAGLVHTLIQPDVATVMPDLPLHAFSPNDIVQLNNACTVAASVVRTTPEVARGVLEFANRRHNKLLRYFYGRTGEPVNDTLADLSTTSCLVRLAANLGEMAVARRWAEISLPGWRNLLTDKERRIYTVGETLLALDALMPPRD